MQVETFLPYEILYLKVRKFISVMLTCNASLILAQIHLSLTVKEKRA